MEGELPEIAQIFGCFAIRRVKARESNTHTATSVTVWAEEVIRDPIMTEQGEPGNVKATQIWGTDEMPNFHLL